MVGQQLIGERHVVDDGQEGNDGLVAMLGKRNLMMG